MMDCTKLHRPAPDPWEQKKAAEKAARKAKSAERSKVREKAAWGAAGALWATAEWTGDELHVDARVLLGVDLTAAPARWLAFPGVSDLDLGIERAVLVRVRKVLRPWRGATKVWFTANKLHVRWRDGLGGFDLWLHAVPKDVEVFEVLLPAREEREAS
jgi:hypothetical protein